MEEILHAFGIDWRLIIIQIVNFGILVGVLWYFLYTPILNLLSERETKIKKGIEDAESAKTALANADQEKTAILKNAHGEASQIVARGTQHAEEKSKTILHETADRVARELESAELLAKEATAKILKESEAEIAKLTILGVERVLRTELEK